MNTAATLRVDSLPTRDLSFQPVLSALKACSFFSSFSPATLAALSQVSSLRSFGPGQVVATEGQRPDHAILVVRGRLRAVRRAARGREVTLEIVRPGELCFEAIFQPESNLAHDWTAGETTLCAFIARDDLARELRNQPEALAQAAAMIARRLRDSKAMAAGLVLDDVEQRLHDVLLRLARGEGEVGPEGTVIRRSPTQQELANMIGACRETVSRIVAELARQGLVGLRGRRLTLTPRFFALAENARAA